MRHFKLLLFIFLLNSCAAPLFITEKNIELYQIEVDQKIGYMDQKGKVRIQPQYQVCAHDSYKLECITDFTSDGFAIVRVSDQYGLINWKGEKILPCIYEVLIAESDSSFTAQLDSKYGIINYKGDTLVPFLFDSPYFLDGKEAFPSMIDDRAVIYDPVSGVITETVYDRIYPFFDGLAEVTVNDKVGQVNRALDLVLDTVYQEVGYFSDGLLNVKIDDEWIFVNEMGEQVLDSSYEEASEFEDGIATVKKGMYGAIDAKGNTVIPFEYVYLSYEGESEKGDAVFMFSTKEEYYLEGSKQGLINKHGDTLLKEYFTNLFYFYDMVEVSLADYGQAGVIDLSTEKVLIPFNFDETDYYRYGLSTLHFSDGAGNQYFGYVNKRNKIIWSNNKTLMKEKLKMGDYDFFD